MELTARPCLAAAATLAAASIVAGTPVVTSSLPEIHVPAIQFIGDSSFFQPILDPAAGFEQMLLDGALTFDKALVGDEGALAGEAFSGMSGLDAIDHEADLIPNAITNLFNANGLLDPTDFNALVPPQLGLDTSAIGGSASGGTDGGTSQISSLAANQSIFMSGDIANAMSAVAADLSQLGTAMTTLNTDLVTAGTDFTSNFVTQAGAIATALQEFNAVDFASALQHLVDLAAFQQVVSEDLPAVYQALIAFGDVFAAGEILTVMSMGGF